MIALASQLRHLVHLWVAALLPILAASLTSSYPGRLLDSAEMRYKATGAVPCNTHFQGYLCQDFGGVCSPLGQTACTNNHPNCSACSAA
jgi:hypothetical protein